MTGPIIFELHVHVARGFRDILSQRRPVKARIACAPVSLVIARTAIDHGKPDFVACEQQWRKYNHATSILAIYFHETSQNKLPEA